MRAGIDLLGSADDAQPTFGAEIGARHGAGWQGLRGVGYGAAPGIVAPEFIEEPTTSMEAIFIPPENLSQWQAAPCFALGSRSSPTELPVASVGVSAESGEQWRLDLFEGVGYSCFQGVRCVGELVYVGYGEQVAVFSPKTGSLVSHPLDGYFAHLFTSSDLDSPDLGSSVLVTSASELLRFDGTGQLLWRSAALGVDGVIVHRVEGGEIVGDAEQDPPGGRGPFRLRFDSGAVC